MIRKEAVSVDVPGTSDDGPTVYKIGDNFRSFIDGAWQINGKITRISVTDSLPGPNGLLWLIKVWVEGVVAMEIPFHQAIEIRYM